MSSWLLASATLLAGCNYSNSAPAPFPNATTTTAALGGVVRVAYAGSLVGAMVNDIGPAFERATGVSFQGLPGGSTGLVNQIKSGTQAFDVFISAAPSANALLMGSANQNMVRWYWSLGVAPLVIGYNPSSKFASALKAGPWYTVMQQPGFLLGRTDPALDPKGVLVEKLLADEATATSNPNLEAAVLGTPENPAQVFPEETLVARLETGQLDAGFFYSNEAALAHIPTISTGVDLGAKFTITILSNASDSLQAQAFVKFLYSKAGQKLLQKVGVTPVSPKLVGDPSALPKGLSL